MAKQTLLRTNEMRPRHWEVLAFGLTVALVAVASVTLRLEPEYLLPVAEVRSDTIVIVADTDAVLLQAGDPVVVATPTGSHVSGNGGAGRREGTQVAPGGVGGTVVEVADSQELAIALDSEVEVQVGGAVVVRAPSVLAMNVLVSRILR